MRKWKSYLVVVVVLLVPALSFAQTVQYEKIAAEYYFNNVFKDKYSKIRRIRFYNKTEQNLSEFGLFKNCFSDSSKNEEEGLRVKLSENAYGKALPKKIVKIETSADVKFKSRAIGSKLTLRIRQANQVEDKIYILIEVTRERYFTDAFMVELDVKGMVIRSCGTGLVY